MKYAVLQNSTQEIIDWFKKFDDTNEACLEGNFKYLIYSPERNDTNYDNFFDKDTIILTPEEFTKKFIKKENMKTITYEQAQSIIDIACDNWKKKLFELWGEDIIFKRNVLIKDEFYKEMRKACTKEQHKLFDEIFGKENIPKEGTLVYVFTSSEWYMRFYSHYEGGEHHCFNNQDKGSIYTTVWNKISLTNPLIEEPQFI